MEYLLRKCFTEWSEAQEGYMFYSKQSWRDGISKAHWIQCHLEHQKPDIKEQNLVLVQLGLALFG